MKQIWIKKNFFWLIFNVIYNLIITLALIGVAANLEITGGV